MGRTGSRPGETELTGSSEGGREAISARPDVDRVGPRPESEQEIATRVRVRDLGLMVLSCAEIGESMM